MGRKTRTRILASLAQSCKMLGEPIFEKICTTNVKFGSQTNLLWLSELSTLVLHKLDLEVLLRVKNCILQLWFHGSAWLLKSWTLVRAHEYIFDCLGSKACLQAESES